MQCTNDQLLSLLYIRFPEMIWLIKKHLMFCWGTAISIVKQHSLKYGTHSKTRYKKFLFVYGTTTKNVRVGVDLYTEIPKWLFFDYKMGTTRCWLIHGKIRYIIPVLVTGILQYAAPVWVDRPKCFSVSSTFLTYCIYLLTVHNMLIF